MAQGNGLQGRPAHGVGLDRDLGRTGMNTPSKDDIIAQILEIMARHNLSLADIEEPENQQEPEVNEH
jgi:hypothetical protein